jgi:hypothetical protein
MKVAERIGKADLLPRMNRHHHARRDDKPNSASPGDNVTASKIPEVQEEIRLRPQTVKAPQASQQKRSQSERDSSDEEQQQQEFYLLRRGIRQKKSTQRAGEIVGTSHVKPAPAPASMPASAPTPASTRASVPRSAPAPPAKLAPSARATPRLANEEVPTPTPTAGARPSQPATSGFTRANVLAILDGAQAQAARDPTDPAVLLKAVRLSIEALEEMTPAAPADAPDLIKVQEDLRNEIKALSGERQKIQDSAQQIHHLLQLQHKKQEAKVAADLTQRKAAAAALKDIREASEKLQQQA